MYNDVIQWCLVKPVDNYYTRRMYLSTFLLVFILIISGSLACNPGEYDDSGCQPCHASCLECNGAGASKCTKCSNGFFLTNTNQCATSCASGYIQNTSTNKCNKCDSSCQNCVNTTTTCTTCSAGKIFFTLNSSCLNSCPIYYKNESGICTIIFCSTYCGNCTGINYNDCTDCFSGFDYHSSVNDCTPNNQNYHIALGTGYYTNYSNISFTFTCGIYANIAGKFAPAQKVSLFSLTDLQTHVAFRLMVWVLWVDQWDNNSWIHFARADNTDYFRVNYSNASGRQSHVCGDSNYRERLTIADGNSNHNSSSITVVAFSDNTPYASSGWGYKQILLLLMKCHRFCQICTSTSNTQCSVCALYQDYKYLLSGTTCAYDCLETYYFHLPWNCTPCTLPCYSCKEPGTICIKCITGHVFFPPNKTCPQQCPPQYYHNLTTDQCQPCYELCYLCTGYPSPCQKCQPDIYFMKYNDTCWDPCPSTFYQYDMEWLCLYPNDYLVNLSLSFQTDGNNLLIQIEFTHELNLTQLGMSSFQTITFKNSAITIDKFVVSYTIVNSTTYTIKLEPRGIIFMRRVPVTVTTKAKTQTFTTYDNLPLSNNCYNHTRAYPWSLMQAPQLNQQQEQITNSLSVASTAFNTFFNSKQMQTIKQLGLFLLLFNYLQIPALIMLLNIVYPVSFYDGTRILASFVLVDIPGYEQQSGNVRYVMSNEWYNINTDSRRLLQSIESPVAEWRFGRTGFLGNFIMDCYGSMIMVLVSITLLVLSNLSMKYCTKSVKYQKLHKMNSYLYSFVQRVNEIVLFSFVLSIYFEVNYFVSSGFRIFSAFLCIALNCYLFFYQLKIFYDLHKLQLKTKEETDILIHKYGSLLKWIRYDSNTKRKCLNRFLSIRQLFQPYSYHVLSYYKKAMMLLSVCMFYDYPVVQISVIVTLQSLEVLRFILTVPYSSKVRNFVQFFLQMILLILFVTILISLTMINRIQTSTDLSFNYSLGGSWVKLGWFMIGLLWLYCLIHLAVDLIGLFYKYRYTNKELYWKNAKKYYYGEIQKYQEHNIEAPTKLITEFLTHAKVQDQKVQISNQNLKPTEIECEEVTFKRQGLLGFEMKLRKTITLRMSKLHKLLHKKCNITIDERVNKKIRITRKTHPILFKLADSTFQAFEFQGKLEEIVLKTFVQIHQNEYAAGECVTLSPDMKYTHQVMFTEENSSTKKVINLDQKLPHYPLGEQYLNKL